MHRNKSVDVHQFAMVPRAEIPRSSFKMEKGLKTTFDSGYLVPILCEEVLPGDSFAVDFTGFARLATPIFPFMDNLHVETFFFFCPNRLVWKNWRRFMGEQANPGDSIDYSIPQTTSPLGGYATGSLQDLMGLPTEGQVLPNGTVTHSALPLRMYNFIFNEWFRDQNLVPASWGFDITSGDGPDDPALFFLRKRGKRHDYFTSALPWVQKGASVTLPLGTTAPVLPTADGNRPLFKNSAESLILFSNSGNNQTSWNQSATVTGQISWDNPGLYADLSAATAATINQLRQSFQIQKLLERDARGGTRYTEIIRSHFGVVSPDARLNRPEYLGGGHSAIQVNPIAQTSATPSTGDGTPLGELAAFAQGTHRASFSQAFTEHGYIIGLCNVRADLSYQQGIRKHWSRKTRYDFYFPAFAMLGEQAILNKEIYVDGSTNDEGVFGYQERWAEYRYNPSEIVGLFRSTATAPLDAWHLAQKFGSLPTLNQTFIEETPPLARVLAVGTEAVGAQIIMDGFYSIRAARPLPLYSVPGMVDHF